MPRPREQVNRGFYGSLLHPVLAVMAPRIEAVLHLALVVNVIESPVTKRDKDHDGDDGGDVAAPARMLRFVLIARRGLTHAERLEARRSTSPSVAIALATMPFASSPAAAYMRSGLSWSWNLSGSVIVRTFSPCSSAPASLSKVSTCAPKPPAAPSSMVMRSLCVAASLRMSSRSRGLAKRASATVVDSPRAASSSAAFKVS